MVQGALAQELLPRNVEQGPRGILSHFPWLELQAVNMSAAMFPIMRVEEAGLQKHRGEADHKGVRGGRESEPKVLGQLLKTLLNPYNTTLL